MSLQTDFEYGIISLLAFCQPAGIAQSVEHFTRNEGVEGSSPFSSLYN